MQDVVAGKPVQSAAVPVPAQHLGLLGRHQAVAKTADDHAPLGWDERRVAQRAVDRERPPELLALDAGYRRAGSDEQI